MLIIKDIVKQSYINYNIRYPVICGVHFLFSVYPIGYIDQHAVSSQIFYKKHKKGSYGGCKAHFTGTRSIECRGEKRLSHSIIRITKPDGRSYNTFLFWSLVNY